MLLLGHFDTVWPLGQIQRQPLEMRDGRLFGPGVYDMKAGLGDRDGRHARAVGA